MHYIHIGLTPKYLSDCVSTVSAASGRYRLRSIGSEAYILPRARTRFGERGIFYRLEHYHPTFMILLIPVHFENDSRMYFLIVLLTDSAGAPGRVV